MGCMGMNKQFEEWSQLGSDKYDLTKRANGVYENDDTRNAWYGWQGRDALERGNGLSNPNNQPKDLWLVVMADPGKGTYTVHAHGHNCAADYRTNPFFCGWTKINMENIND